MDYLQKFFSSNNPFRQVTVIQLFIFFKPAWCKIASAAKSWINSVHQEQQRLPLPSLLYLPFFYGPPLTNGLVNGWAEEAALLLCAEDQLCPVLGAGAPPTTAAVGRDVTCHRKEISTWEIKVKNIKRWCCYPFSGWGACLSEFWTYFCFCFFGFFLSPHFL